MGISIYDRFESDGKTYVIFEFSGLEFNKYGKYLEIDTSFLHLYPSEFENVFIEKYPSLGNSAKIFQKVTFDEETFKKSFYKLNIHRNKNKLIKNEHV